MMIQIAKPKVMTSYTNKQTNKQTYKLYTKSLKLKAVSNRKWGSESMKEEKWRVVEMLIAAPYVGECS